MIVDYVFTFFAINFNIAGIAVAIFGVSLVINFLALPLYNIAERLQEKEQKNAKKMEVQIKRIKSTFKGDERFMMLQAYYKECKYNPIYTFRSSLSILIEIPFFIAAYHYLSHAEPLKGATFLFINDLGSPDAFFRIGNFSVNILPILMTIINLISGAIYTENTTLREKIQIFVLALIFLVLLYNSPSGLVFYWTLNNIFSLVKNIIKKIRKKSLQKNNNPNAKKVRTTKSDAKTSKSQFLLFLLSALGLSLLCGIYLPSSAICTSPIEFSFLGKNADSPLVYVWSSFFTFLGFFVLWSSVIYFMFSENVKKWESAIFFAGFIISLFDVFIFKADYGYLDISFQLGNPNVLTPNVSQIIFPILICVALFFIFYFLRKYKKLNIASGFIFAICVAELFISSSNISVIGKKFSVFAKDRQKNEIALNNSESKYNSELEIKPVYHLSKTGKNVVVIFVDRAINSFFPYALKDLPELKNQMNGFVYFPNTLSFGEFTNIASPAMMAGYEYTPEKINERKNELLMKKHNEATLVLPTLFANADYEVTVTDPPFPNYSWKGDLSAFENKKNISVYELYGKYTENFVRETNFTSDEVPLPDSVKLQVRNFALLQILFPIFRPIFYENFKNSAQHSSQNLYFDNISCLYYLPELTDFSTNKNQYLFIDNETTHQPIFLKEDFLLPSKNNFFHGSYKTSKGIVETHYHTFVAVFKQIGKWLDFLRENNVYDNTRIIIVSDHGRKIPLNDFNNFKNPEIPASFTPILLFKDFNSNSELKTDNSFMTNADTIFLAKKDLPLSNENPFTHKEFVQEKSDGINVYPTSDLSWNAEMQKGKTKFKLEKNFGFHVKDNIFDEKNWKPLQKKKVKKAKEK